MIEVHKKFIVWIVKIHFNKVKIILQRKMNNNNYKKLKKIMNKMINNKKYQTMKIQVKILLNN